MKQGKQQKKSVVAGKQGHKVRIVGGLWKRTPIVVSDVDGLRPTPERVRETLFNWLTHLRGNGFKKMRALDLFAGTGALGFEAASRGFMEVVMAEQDDGAYRQLISIRKKLSADHVEIHRTDAVQFSSALAGTGRQFDVVFLDPPFQKNLLPKVVPHCVRILARGGMIYIESNEPVTEEMLAGWQDAGGAVLVPVRQGKAGQVYYHLLEMQDKSPS